MTGSKAVRSVGSLVVLASVCLTGPSFGQASFAGVWNMTLTEDFPDRLPGPELGDYAGLPLNAADRARARLSEGYFRKNGIPYSAAAALTEYFDLLGEPDGSQWLVVKAIVDDPAYLAVAPITSSTFRKQTDRSGWDPQPCSAR